MALVALAQAVATAEFGPRKPVLNRDVAAGGVDHQLGNGEGRNAVGTFLEQPRVLLFDLVQAADARAENARRSGRGLPWRSRCRSRRTASMRRDHGELREAIDPLGVFRR